MNDRKKTAQLIIDSLAILGIESKLTISKVSVLVNEKPSIIRQVMQMVDYPAHLIGHNVSYRSAYPTQIKTA